MTVAWRVDSDLKSAYGCSADVVKVRMQLQTLQLASDGTRLVAPNLVSFLLFTAYLSGRLPCLCQSSHTSNRQCSSSATSSIHITNVSPCLLCQLLQV